MAIWQELVDDHGFTGGYQSVSDLSASCADLIARSRVVIITAPGEDYGKFRVMVRSGVVPIFLAEISAASVT